MKENMRDQLITVKTLKKLKISQVFSCNCHGGELLRLCEILSAVETETWRALCEQEQEPPAK